MDDEIVENEKTEEESTTEITLLDKVKKTLGISGTYQDELLNLYIEATKRYMRDAGVSQEAVDADSSVVIITKGVIDLWSYSEGKGRFSALFKDLVNQLRLTSGKDV